MALGKLTTHIVLGALAAFGGSSACSPESARRPGETQKTQETPPGYTGPTYHRDIEPILQRACQSCHRPSGIAPFALTTHETARAVSGAMVEATESRRMPPWGARETDECKPKLGWQRDARLSDAEIALLRAWHEAGAPRGNPMDAPPPVDITTGLPRVDLELSLPTPYVAEGDGDVFRCFAIDPGLVEARWVSGVHVVPGNPQATHHVDVYTDPSGAAAALAGNDGSYPCFGGVGVDDARMIHTFNPGMFPLELPPGVAMELSPGSLVVLQVHYHVGGALLAPDGLKVQLQLADQKPDHTLHTLFVGNFSTADQGLLPGPNDTSKIPAFRIPAEVPDHEESMRFTWPASYGSPRVFGAAAHMHYVGKGFQLDLDRGGKGSECLLQETDWNIDWQRMFLYDAPLDALPRLDPGDTLALRCRYDNTMDHPGTRKILLEQGLSEPVDVHLGETVLDEMCLAILPLIYPSP